MTDHDLLRLAAKAAGIEVHEGDDGTAQRRPIWCVTHYVQGQPYCDVPWNPLTDDGDALRLAVKLKFALNIWGPGVVVSCSPRIDVESFGVETGSDPYAATRLAIVQAAAAIGASMP